MKMKRVLALVLASMMILSACGDEKMGERIEDFPYEGSGNMSDVNLVYEAEDAKLEGGLSVKSGDEFSGGKYVGDFSSDSNVLTFEVEVPEDGHYNLTFSSKGIGGNKENNLVIDGKANGSLTTPSGSLEDSIVKGIYLTKGKHDISIKKNWGWICLDKLTISNAAPQDTSIYEVSYKLINKNASVNTKRLYNFLVDTYGNYIISGQTGDGPADENILAVKKYTGKYPVIACFDMIDYSPSRVARGSNSKSIENAIAWDKMGGIVEFAWHWNAPTKYLPDTAENPWWSGFYIRATTINLADIMSGADPEGYDLLISDIDAIAKELKKLADKDIPVLWRPLHEASGGWFWWGAFGADAYKELWKLMYDRLTNYHKLNNLIWVFNGQNKDWYPGDEYVDIIGEDIYPAEHDDSAQTGRFEQALDYTSTNKIIALTENGSCFDPDYAFRDNARWAWFAPWSGGYTQVNGEISDQHTSKELWAKIYNHERVLTLDEIPNLKEYPYE